MKILDGASVIVCLLIAFSAIEALPFAPIADIDREIATRAENLPVAELSRASQGLHGRDVDIIKRRDGDPPPTPPGVGHPPPPGFGRPRPLELPLTPPQSPPPGQSPHQSPPGSAFSIPDDWPLPPGLQNLSPDAQGLFTNQGHPQENHQPGTQTHQHHDLSLANLSPVAVAQGLFANHPSHPQEHQQPVAQTHGLSLGNLPPITDALFGNTAHPPNSHQATVVSGGHSAAPAAGHGGHHAPPPHNHHDGQSSTSPRGPNGGS